jgi:acyl-homoserine lactone acylase PvdQ
MKSSKIIFLLLLVISYTGISAFVEKTGRKKDKAQQYHGQIFIPALTCDVVVKRDMRGMPHLYASNEQEAHHVQNRLV